MARLPEQVGRYRVVDVVGTGAFATVYRARDDRFDGDVALKVLAENHAFDPDLRERFILEGRLLRRLGGPHIIQVHDLDETDRSQPFLVLDLAEGGDLRRRVREARASGWTPTAADVVTVVNHLAAAMTELHRAEVVHRDLAPGNLLIVGSSHSPAANGSPAVQRRLLNAGERLVVADLGLSKDLARASGLTVGTGTTGFTPPEQRSAGGWVDTRADIWSASALIVWLLSGATPTDDPGRAWRDQLVSHGWPIGLIRALDHGSADDPANRPPDADAWRRSIVEALGAPASTPPVIDAGSSNEQTARPLKQQPEPGHAPARRFADRRTILAFAAAALVALIVGGLIGSRLASDGNGNVSTAERTELDDGRVRFRTSVGASSVAVTGPASTSVDTPVTLTATGDRLASTTWITPDGQVYEDRDRIQVTASSTGTATVIAVGRDVDGRQLVVEFELRVR